MPSNIIEPGFIRYNLHPLYVLLFFIFPIAIVVSNIPLLFIILIGISWKVIIIYFEKNTKVISVAIPVGKVIWTKRWEKDAKRVISQSIPQHNNRFTNNINNLLIIYYATEWEEQLCVDNTLRSLYNYNTIIPVRGFPINPLF